MVLEKVDVAVAPFLYRACFKMFRGTDLWRPSQFWFSMLAYIWHY
jgi:hypothetical protein